MCEEKYEKIKKLVDDLFDDSPGVALSSRKELIHELVDRDCVCYCMQLLCTKLWEFKRNGEIVGENRGKLWYPVSLIYGNRGDNIFTQKISQFGLVDKLKKIQKSIILWKEWENVPSVRYMLDD